MTDHFPVTRAAWARLKAALAVVILYAAFRIDPRACMNEMWDLMTMAAKEPADERS